MKDEREPSNRLSVWLDTESEARVRRCAEADGMSVSTWIRVVIQRALRCRAYDQLAVTAKRHID